MLDGEGVILDLFELLELHDNARAEPPILQADFVAQEHQKVQVFVVHFMVTDVPHHDKVRLDADAEVE